MAAYGGHTYAYTYDNGGNILSVTKDGSAVKSYIYGDTEWKDLLTCYNGHAISYDGIGNPLTYRDGFNFTWSNGRELTGITKGTDSISYLYNADGLRTSKTVNGITTDYYWLNGILLGQKTGNEYILFLYDENGSAYGMLLNNGTTEEYYYYLFNAQGDITGIVDSNGQKVVEYTYGAWGDITAITGTLADTVGQINPIRYRGYYYDAESGFYYVSSRYYDPEVGRFINADDIDYLGADGSSLSYNLFAYCMNNPVNRFDVNGNWSLPNWAKVTIGAVAIAGLAVATVCTGGAAAVICGAALSGAIAGGASGAVMGAIGGGISGGWQGALDGACSGFMSGTLIGGVTGAASAGLNIATGATTVVGNAHGSTLHKLATNMEAGKMAASGQYSQIGVNKALKTMGLNGTSRPDVIGVAKNGMNKIVEVVSPRQSTNYIINKMSNMLSNNPGSVGKIVNWVRRLFK